MARFSALSVVAQGLAALLSEGRPGGDLRNAVFPIVNASTLNALAGSVPIPALGVSIFPYRVGYNANRRPVKPRINANGERFRAPLLLDLHVLLTAWATDAGQQLRLLAWAARTFDDTPSLPPGFLNRFGPDGETVFDPTETVELAYEPLAVQELVAIWEVNKARQQPSLSYVVRMIPIDSDVRLPDAGIVRSRNFEHGVLVR
jgi:hypothetical protein